MFVLLFSGSDLRQHIMKTLPAQESTGTRLHASALSGYLGRNDLTRIYAD